MAGYAIIWLFFAFFALVFIAMTIAYYAKQFVTFLWKYWQGE